MKAPALIDVKSTHIDAIGHRAGSLYVRFKSGALFKYDDVPETIYHGGLGAESPGRWFREHVRGRFTSNKLDA